MNATPQNTTDEKIIAQCHASVRPRRRIELTIVRRVISDLTAAGYTLRVDDGGDTTTGTEDELVEAIFAVDQAYLRTHKDGEDEWIFFVLGNDGPDVICDYTVDLHDVLDSINEWVNAQVDAGVWDVRVDP